MPATGLPRLAFIHIPKTAGTSVGAYLSGVYGSLTFEAYTTIDYQEATDEALRRFRFYKGHMYRSDYERLPSDTQLFSIFRDPAERVVSLYRYYREVGFDHLTDDLQIDALRSAKSKSLMEFCYSKNPFLQHQIRLGQILQFLPAKLASELLDFSHLPRPLMQIVIDEFTYAINEVTILTMDYLPITFPAFLERINVPLPTQLDKLNASDAAGSLDDASTIRAREYMMDISPVEYHCFRIAQRAESGFLCALGSQPPRQVAAAGGARG